MVNLVMEINVAEDATHVGAVSFGELSKLYIPVFQSAKAWVCYRADAETIVIAEIDVRPNGLTLYWQTFDILAST